MSLFEECAPLLLLADAATPGLRTRLPPAARCLLQGQVLQAHKLECVHLLLASAGRELDAASSESGAAMQAHCQLIDALLASGEPLQPTAAGCSS